MAMQMSSSSQTKSSSLGSSLLVPCVQELAKEPLISVPERYIRTDLDLNPVSLDHGDQVPVIDFQRLLDPVFMASELPKLHSACRDWGFFQLVNHGVSTSLLDNIKTQVQDFFNLPMEEKRKFWQYPGQLEGFGQAYVVSDEQKLDWGDLFLILTHPVHMRMPHLFPNLPLPLRDTLEDYSSEVKKIAMRLFDLMAIALNIKPEEMRDFPDGIRQTIRMSYYPPSPEPEKVIGISPHSDGTGLTILLQINDVDGLQILKDGKWVSIKPLENAFVVNIGDILEIITNGTYRSILHRATVNSKKERMSISSFHSPRYYGKIGPALSLITEQRPVLYRGITAQEFFKGLYSRELRDKLYIDNLKIKHDEA